MTFAFSQVVFGALLCGLAVWVIADRRSSRKMAQMDWKNLVDRIYRLNMVGLSAVAVDYLTPRRGQVDLEPN